jgi:hypothetical protein
MHGTLQPTKPALAGRRRSKAKIVALAVIAGMLAGSLVYSLADDDLMIFLGFTYPKDCG